MKRENRLPSNFFLPLALGMSLIAPLTTYAQEEVYLFPQGQDLYFRSYAITSSQYIYFGGDGNYIRLVRGHVGVHEKDRGLWDQNEDGTIILQSEKLFRNIVVGPMSISLVDPVKIDRLPPLKQDIEAFLKNNETDTFKSEDIENIRRYTSKWGSDYSYPAIDVDYKTKSISRNQLMALNQAINNYLSSDTKHHFHLIPMKDLSCTFLVWKDSESFLNRDINRIIEKLVKAEKKDTFPNYVYIEIDEKLFEAESGRPQPFICHTEMNKCFGAPGPEQK